MLICGYPLLSVALICLGVFVAGFVDAIGGGGGLISLPMYLFAGLPTHYALGTNKLSSVLGTAVSTARYVKNGYIVWKLALPSILFAMLGAHFGTKLQLLVDESYLRYILIVVLIPVAGMMFRKKALPETAGEIGAWKQRLIVWGVSLIIGVYDGFYGPGSGTFLLLAFCKLAKMDLRTASGNVKVVNLSSNAGALFTSLAAGKLLAPIGLIAGVFSVAGHYVGSGMMIKNGAKVVKPVILAVLSILFMKTLFELIGA